MATTETEAATTETGAAEEAPRNPSGSRSTMRGQTAAERAGLELSPYGP